MQTIIRLDNVAAGYDGREQIHGVSLDVADRDFIVVTGPNGSGKTTLMRVILGLISPMQGTVSYPQYADAAGLRGALRPRFGYLPQYSAIDREFPIDVRDTVFSGLNGSKGLFGRINAADRRAVELTMERLELTGLARRPIGRLSGGQLQRVLMARAIVSEPDVLIFDEPTTYTDNRSWQRMSDIVGDLHRRCAVIIVSHDADFIGSISPARVLRMEGGSIIT